MAAADAVRLTINEKTPRQQLKLRASRRGLQARSLCSALSS